VERGHAESRQVRQDHHQQGAAQEEGRGLERRGARRTIRNFKEKSVEIWKFLTVTTLFRESFWRRTRRTSSTLACSDTTTIPNSF
jgi:hypothetical protein